ncbi:neural-cadherin [Caerostris extrusa]|uniref:Neural-cadherin n=1 Tax=Caerostris extrusa TaxID=172846 RepID=A0AAV4RRE9_CAEEX|nr:neural-cadherin [Caerostris extrusa]
MPPPGFEPEAFGTNSQSSSQLAISPRVVCSSAIYSGSRLNHLGIKVPSEISLTENEISPFFTLLSDGSLISTSNLSHFIDKPIDLIIQEKLDDQTVIQNLKIHVRNRNRMLLFPKSEYHGYIFENEPNNTIVKVEDSLAAMNAIGNVTYSLSGSDDFAILQKGGIIHLISMKKLDRELQKQYSLILNATDAYGSTANTNIKVNVKDVNDNVPKFPIEYYIWNISLDTPQYSKIGKVQAYDADGDKPVYLFYSTNTRPFVIVPQTGEILLMGKLEPRNYNIFVAATDNRDEPIVIGPAARVQIKVSDRNVIEDSNRSLRRQKRSIRQTKTYEHFLESDGNTPGKVMFRLDSVHPDEVFSLENESRWIDVDHNGDVKVKEPWDYEQLEREKTIDFWVKIRAPQQPGKL